jgi:predicted secreted Zn-dependent protease
MAFPFVSIVGGRTLRSVAIAIVAVMLVADGFTAFAGVTSTTSQRYYTVSGTAKSTLARRMRSNPFRGDGGGAVANIRPKYSLDVVTKKTGSSCKVVQANLKVRFTLTLPRAKESAMSA